MTVIYALLAMLVVTAVILMMMTAKLKTALAKQESSIKSVKQNVELLQVKINYLAAVALGQLGLPGAIHSLIPILKTENAEIRQAAAETLVRFGQETIKPLTAALLANEVPISLGVNILMRCARSEDDLLFILQNGIHSAEICRGILSRPDAGTEVLTKIAEEGPIEALSVLVSLEKANNSDAQVTAQKRLHQEAVRRQEEQKQEEEKTRYSFEDDGYETGPCHCRWQ